LHDAGEPRFNALLPASSTVTAFREVGPSGAQNDQPVFYEEVFRKLNEAGVRYLVAGGMAVNLHGVPRLREIQKLEEEDGRA